MEWVMSRTLIPIIIVCLWSSYSPGWGENYLLNGGQRSKISYRLIQKIKPTEKTVTVDLTFVEPGSFQSASYMQEIQAFKITSTLEPKDISTWSDAHNNKIIKYTWEKPGREFEVELTLKAVNSVKLERLNTSAPFPVENPGSAQKPYLSSSRLVPTDDPVIAGKARELTKTSKSQFDAVQKILSYIIDHVDYVLTPPDYGARYTIDTGRGNCQNFSHLAAALLRSVDIPVRIVNGVTFKEPYDIRVGNQTLSLNMAQGRHSWIEVYFPDLGWMPFDPQQSELFVSNRFLRVEVGVDNEETVNDGLVKWTRQKGSTEVLSFDELIEADFTEDNISITGSKLEFGPRGLLLQPAVTSEFVPVKKPAVKEVQKFDLETLSRMKFASEFEAGNSVFTEGINFAFLREKVETEEGKVLELKKNFLVETAEYVTGKRQYAQVFLLDQPVMLKNIGLALQNFGGNGVVWVDLREDQNGNPGPVAARSAEIPLAKLSAKPGYYWVDFSFSDQQLVLTPDKYWLTIGSRGTPILNWFYSYGKPFGPIDGTRYRMSDSGSWDNSVGFEFNFRVTGLAAEK